MGTKNKPGEYDCYANAEPDEPMFVLLARDELAPLVVRQWASLYASRIDARDDPPTDKQRRKHREALNLADQMERWMSKRDVEVGS